MAFVWILVTCLTEWYQNVEAEVHCLWSMVFSYNGTTCSVLFLLYYTDVAAFHLLMNHVLCG